MTHLTEVQLGELTPDFERFRTAVLCRGEPDHVPFADVTVYQGHKSRLIGPTASLMQAIQKDGEPETSGADNIQTLRVVEACYLSAAENRSVRLDECQAIPCPD